MGCVVERSTLHRGPKSREELPPAPGDIRTPSVPPSHSQTAPETWAAAARVSGDALHRAGLPELPLPTKPLVGQPPN